MSHHIERIFTDKGPPPQGPYNQAVKAGNMIFTAAMGAIDPKTNKRIDGDIPELAEQLFSNIKAVLAEAGASLDDVVKATVYLTVGDDPAEQRAHFEAFNKVYETHFTGVRPARAFINIYRPSQVPNVGMDVIAVTHDGHDH